MFLVEGTRCFKKVFGQTSQFTLCEECGNAIKPFILREFVWITLFLVPIIPTPYKWYIMCPVCGSRQKIKKSLAMNLFNQSV